MSPAPYCAVMYGVKHIDLVHVVYTSMVLHALTWSPLRSFQAGADGGQQGCSVVRPGEWRCRVCCGYVTQFPPDKRDLVPTGADNIHCSPLKLSNKYWIGIQHISILGVPSVPDLAGVAIIERLPIVRASVARWPRGVIKGCYKGVL